METPRKPLRNKHLDNVVSQLTPVKVPSTPLLKQLGCGTGVNVYQLNRSPNNGKIMSPWALKRVSKRISKNSADRFSSMMKKEAEILRKLCHPNIVGFRGVLKTSDGQENLALECCGLSLNALLEAKTDIDDWEPLPADNIKRMCLDICKALNYLHNEAKILHGDIKSPNILVKGDFEICKLCDFGVALPLNEKGELDLVRNPNAEYIGTGLWKAPEALNEDNITDKCDIFSFGLVIYETIALIPPHTWVTLNSSDRDSDESSTTNEGENVEDLLEQLMGTRPPLPESFQLSDDYCQVIEIFYLCTNLLAEDRPNAISLLRALTT